MLAWLEGDEPAAAVLQDAFVAGRPWMSWINIGEVACQLERRHGADEAALVVSRLRAALALDDVTPDRVLAAAHIKPAHPIAFADCFAAATAAARDPRSSRATRSFSTATSAAACATYVPHPAAETAPQRFATLCHAWTSRCGNCATTRAG